MLIRNFKNGFWAIILLFLQGCVAPQAASQPPVSPNDFIIRSVLFFLVIFGVYWALILRPMQLKQAEKEKLFSELKKGDEVVTSGGILGKVVAITKDEITIEISANCRVRVQCEHVHTLPAKDSTSAKEIADKTKKS
ncbi:MAG: preprotein translocase subunit YajC [Deltaproteobacteria bacterium]|nr:preprotein translocase subunit YajC [Deltaproteobacteria bacterium]